MMNDEKAKAKAFDEVYEQCKFWRKRTNIQEWRDSLDRVLREFEWQYVRMSGTNRCLICNKTLPPSVWKWAFKKGIRWFCGEHYINANFKQAIASREDAEELEPLFKTHRRSFVIMMNKEK